MDIRKIINDAYKDFKTEFRDVNVSNEIVEQSLEQIINSFEQELDIPKIYSICNQYMWDILIDLDYSTEELKYTPIDIKTKEEFLKAAKEKICTESIMGESLYTFMKAPKQMDIVYNNSHKIFLKAKEAYINGPNDKDIEYCEKLFKEIEDIGSQLSNIDYTYTYELLVKNDYEEELSEAQIDLDIVKGNDFILSFRMKEYAEHLEYTEHELHKKRVDHKETEYNQLLDKVKDYEQSVGGDDPIFNLPSYEESEHYTSNFEDRNIFEENGENPFKV